MPLPYLSTIELVGWYIFFVILTDYFCQFAEFDVSNMTLVHSKRFWFFLSLTLLRNSFRFFYLVYLCNGQIIILFHIKNILRKMSLLIRICYDIFLIQKFPSHLSANVVPRAAGLQKPNGLDHYYKRGIRIFESN